ncbi:MAG: GWxTD domain-containing protein [Candidatus Eisenbacteria bacterium]|nr:GWxTD domain-containing protein [Candidatus Eisenbacteria bacterium]
MRLNHSLLVAILASTVAGLCLVALPPPLLASDFGFDSQRARESPHFYADATFFPSLEKEGTLEIHYDISYSQLKFLKRTDGFLARFEVQAVLYDTKGKQVGGDSWRRNVACSSYKETISPEGSYQETFRLEVAAGRYNLLVRTENLDAEERSSVLLKLDLEPFKFLPAISDLLIGRCRADSADSGQLRSRLVPFPRARFGERFPTVCVYGNLYDTPAEGDTGVARIAWRVLDEEGTVKLQDTLNVTRKGRISPFLVTYSVDNLTMGRHTLELFLGRMKGTPSARRTFEVDESKFDLDKKIDDTLALLSYIAPRSETEAIKQAAGAERKRLWIEFWKKKDPYPETPENEFLMEFFDRVGYANENFSSIQRGWKTDRGRIYIRRGAPDQIDSRPFNAAGPAYEVWYYYQQNLAFVFVDRMGLGDYELVGPNRE